MTSLKWRSPLTITLAFFVVFTPLAATYPTEAPLKKVAVAYPAFGSFFLWFLLEKELGFFQEEGLRPEFILVRGGGLSVKGLIAKNFDYVHNTGAVLDAIVRGKQPLKIVFTAAKMHYWLVAQPQIRSVEDLKGKSIGTGGSGSITEVTIREILKRHGLDPFRDVAFVGIGGTPDRLTALMSGAVQAAILNPPWDLKAVQAGYRRVVKATDYVRWPAAGIATREEKLLREPAEVEKMVRASFKGLRFLLTQRDYILVKMMQMFRTTHEEAIQTYDVLKDDVFVPSGYFSEEDQRAVIAMMQQAASVSKPISPEQVFDYRFVKQVEQDLKGWRPQIPK